MLPQDVSLRIEPLVMEPMKTNRYKENSMNQVDQLLLNARLRDEIEPFADESIALLDSRHLPIDFENEFLTSMLEWERAPVLPIGRWYEPELRLPPPDTLNDEQLRQELHQVIGRLYERNIVLEYTDHLSDRQLMCLIIRDILPAQEKRLASPSNFLHWQCIDEDSDSGLWLTYYASDRQRRAWQEENGKPLPPKQVPPCPRRLPGEPQCD